MARGAFLLTGFLLAGGFGPPAAAQSALCPQHDADAAEAMVDDIKTWKDVDTAFARYRNCDDGSIAEGNAEAIAHLLTEHWITLPELASLSAHRPGLQAFVLSHINQTLDTAELRKIASLSMQSCPSGEEALCKKLQRTATFEIQ